MAELDRYKPAAEAFCLLLAPHAEVVIHDLRTNQIAAIYNNFSKRKVGDESLLDLAGEIPDLIPVYFKINWDGRKIKSVSAALKDSAGKTVGLLCINLDVSKWEEFHHFLGCMLQQPLPMPEILFKDDWRERINAYITTHLKKERLSLSSLTKEEKQNLVLALYKEGAFEAKNAASYIGKVLNASRATIYNYLREK